MGQFYVLNCYSKLLPEKREKKRDNYDLVIIYNLNLTPLLEPQDMT